MDGRINNKGTKGNKGGNPGHGKLGFIRDKVVKYSELWWGEWEEMMNSKPDEFINDNVKDILKDLTAKGDNHTVKEIIEGLAKGAFYRKQFAMNEFNKLQAKMIPQQIEDDDGNSFRPVLVTFLNGNPSDNRNPPGI